MDDEGFEAREDFTAEFPHLQFGGSPIGEGLEREVNPPHYLGDFSPAEVSRAEEDAPVPREEQDEPHPHRGIHWRQDAGNEMLALILRELRIQTKEYGKMTSAFDTLSSKVDAIGNVVQSFVGVVTTAISELDSWKSSGSNAGPTDDQINALSDKLQASIDAAQSSVSSIQTAETNDAPTVTDPSAPVAPIVSQPVVTGDPTTQPVDTDPSLGASATATVPDADVAATPGPAPTGFDALGGTPAGQQTNVPGL